MRGCRALPVALVLQAHENAIGLRHEQFPILFVARTCAENKSPFLMRFPFVLTVICYVVIRVIYACHNTCTIASINGSLTDFNLALATYGIGAEFLESSAIGGNVNIGIGQGQHLFNDVLHFGSFHSVRMIDLMSIILMMSSGNCNSFEESLQKIHKCITAVQMLTTSVHILYVAMDEACCMMICILLYVSCYMYRCICLHCC